MRLRSQRIVVPGGMVDGEVMVDDGRIAAVGPAPSTRPAGSTKTDAVELGRAWLVPGFIDVHVHGGGGAQCNTSDPSEVIRMARFHAGHGTTGLVATTVAAPVDELCESLAAIAACRALPGGETVLGAHLEGPFLSPGRPGAMDPSVFISPDRSVLNRLLAAGRGAVLAMTLAPELPGALWLIGELGRAGVVASIGHTNATFDQVCEAVRAGARAATHVFNAMPSLHHRAPGVIGAVLDLPEVSCELICDGIHVDPAALRLVYRAKGLAGVRLVTDATEAAGMPDGDYRLGGARVSVIGGRAVIPGSGAIAGSTLTMDAAVRNAVRFFGVGVQEAVVMASSNPARLLGLTDRKGAVRVGADADLVVLDEGLAVRGVMVAGQWVVEP